MKHLLIVTAICFSSFFHNALAQLPSKAYGGLGIGLPFGGFGAQALFLPTPKVGLFTGLGYNLDGLGFNAGAQWRFSNRERKNFYLTGMYGYNTVLAVEGKGSTTYYGPTFGVGMESKSSRHDSFWSFELLFPIRSKTFFDDVDNLKAIGYNITDPLPITFAIGYHFAFSQNK